MFFLRIFCVNYALYPIHTANLNAIKALGRSDYYLILEIIKKSIGVILLVFSISNGVKIMASSILITTIISSFLNSYPNKKLLNYTYNEQIKDILPSVIVSLLMGIIVYPISFLGFSDVLTVLFEIISGVLFYLFASRVLNLKSYYFIKNVLKEVINT